MSTTASTMAIVANTNAAIASANAHAARKATCENVLQTYDAQRATVQQAKTYAECVHVVHPEPIEDTTGLRVAVALLIVAFFGGAVFGWLSEDNIGFSLAYALLFPFVLVLAYLVIAAVYFGVRFVVGV